MVSLLMRLLPSHIRELIQSVRQLDLDAEDIGNVLELSRRVFGQLNTAEELKSVLKYGLEIIHDGKVTVAEWSSLGGAKHLGGLRGPR